VTTARDAAAADGNGTGVGAGPFETFAPRDVCDLIAQFPLAWVCARHGAAREASLLPLLGEYEAGGRLAGLLGHLGRRNPLVAALSADPRAVILFRGPEAYISPEHAGRRDWAPTWNYAQLHIEATVQFLPEETGMAVRRLVDTMEAEREAPWRPEELGDRYAAMERQIVGFRAEVTRLRGRFKLGQDEAPQTLRAIIDNIADPAMARWMRRFNAERL
jgi:transcriptional regulator